MKSVRRRPKKKKINFIFIAFILTLIYFSYALVRQGVRISSYEGELNTYIARRDELVDEISTLQEDYKNRESLEFAEKVAREKLGMIKAKEYLVKEK
ncbi:septum formation initiator family protein [Lagierella sp.]|uniref:FtsB family cell division protein n=1 Tax=Lagierella sp. TaxID=2849657 RepID=UPI00262E43C3|nr:septum formation initiator family protein [Lagierella sp.]